MQIGSFRLRVVKDGGFRLDGGAMFGVVPKVLWQQKKPADERNRIRMATNCLLIEAGTDLVLIDTGLGDKNDAKFRDMFGLESGATRLPESIGAAGFALEDVTHVLLTHLHFDHSGWNTREESGHLVPTFPNARYWIEEGELEHASRPNERDRASYDARNWEPLIEAGVVERFRGEGSPVTGIRAVRAPGHNADMCVVLIEGGDESDDVAETAIFLADLVPTTAHLPYPWVMGFDLYPLETVENKKAWLPRAHAGGWVCFFEHDTEVESARLVETKPGRFGADPVAA